MVTANKLVTDAKTGALKSNTDYMVCENNQITWSNLIVSSSAGCRVVAVCVDVVSSSDDISLDMISVVSLSKDGNYLGRTNSFGDKAYTPIAIGIKSDGSVITSGLASQKVSRVIVIVFPRLFGGGDTQSGLDEVKNWVTGFKNYTVKYTVSVGNESSQLITSIVGVPVLAISRDGQLSIINAVPGFKYPIQGKMSFSRGNWYTVGVIEGSASIIPMDKPWMFYRVAVAE
jgi:hypothetical protein